LTQRTDKKAFLRFKDIWNPPKNKNALGVSAAGRGLREKAFFIGYISRRGL
jgi:hypothetical protein